MSAAGLLMAGGAGRRMQASGRFPVKPLVPVRGVPLLERNLLTLLGTGLREIHVAIPASNAPLRSFLDERVGPVAAALGVCLGRIEEPDPLGTIGCAAALAGRADSVLVVNADNLTTLDLRAVLAEHRRCGAALTLAAHRQPLPLDFGELVVDGSRVVEYREKPVRHPLVCSAVSVLGQDALAALKQGEALGLPALVERLLADGRPVHAFVHASPWIDVNDADALREAEALVAAHPERFECWADEPDLEVVGALLSCDGDLLLERRPPDASLYPGLWDTPGGKIEPGETPAAAWERELREELGLDLCAEARLAVFDDVDPHSRRVVRHHVFGASVERDAPRPQACGEVRWVSRAHAGGPEPTSPVVARSVAALAEGA